MLPSEGRITTEYFSDRDSVIGFQSFCIIADSGATRVIQYDSVEYFIWLKAIAA